MSQPNYPILHYPLDSMTFFHNLPNMLELYCERKKSCWW